MYQKVFSGYAFSMESEQNDCVFCKLIRNEIPRAHLYEDANTLAFLDIAPNSAGHTLVVPKRHVRNVFDIDQATFGEVMETVRKLAPIIRDAVGAKGVHITSNHEPEAGQEVFHLHMHIIPRHDRSEFEFWPKIQYAPGEAEATAAKIRAGVEKKLT